MDPSRTPSGFSLIELLVVVTLIVVLLALLTPALDHAIYQAELAVCAANLKGVASGSTLYAMDSRRRYFHRPGVFASNANPGYLGWYPQWLARPREASQWIDDRPTIRPFVDLRLFVDPLAGQIRLEEENTKPESVIEPATTLWAGYRWSGQSGMLRVGDRMTWGRETFSVLATDLDVCSGPPRSLGQVYVSHPDREAGLMKQETLQDAGFGADPTGTQILQWTLNRWNGVNTLPARGACDFNYGYADGSVRRLNAVAEGDDRVNAVPHWTTSGTSGWRRYLPAD